MPYRVAITDDKPNIIASLAKYLIYSDQVEVVFTDNGADFIDKLSQYPKERHPQVVLMDLDMPVMNGIEAIRKCSAMYPHIQYVILTVFDDDDKLFEALRAGANGYLLKEEPFEVILHAIEEMIEKKGAPMSARIARKTLNFFKTNPGGTTLTESGLSEREGEILKSMVSGLDYKQIGEKLFISPNTVRNHITKIYDKLHITSKAQAVNLAVRNRWV